MSLPKVMRVLMRGPKLMEKELVQLGTQGYVCLHLVVPEHLERLHGDERAQAVAEHARAAIGPVRNNWTGATCDLQVASAVCTVADGVLAVLVLDELAAQGQRPETKPPAPAPVAPKAAGQTNEATVFGWP